MLFPALMSDCRFFILTGVTCLLAACAKEPNALSAQQRLEIEDQISARFESLAATARAGAFEQYLSHMDRDAISTLNADGSTFVSLDEFRSAYAPQFNLIEAYNYLNFDPVRIEIIDANTAILINEYVAKLVLKSGETITASGAGAQVWSKKIRPFATGTHLRCSQIRVRLG
ncbi:MAG: hypothetical protein AAFX02_06435 [Pseudomonadota bacterium]